MRFKSVSNIADEFESFPVPSVIESDEDTDYPLIGYGIEPGAFNPGTSQVGDPKWFFTENRGSFKLFPVPDKDACLYNIQVVVKPKPIDFTIYNQFVLLPDYLVDNHSDTIALKAISMLLSNRNNEFYDPGQNLSLIHI